jgi:hypothetical protein
VASQTILILLSTNIHHGKNIKDKNIKINKRS